MNAVMIIGTLLCCVGVVVIIGGIIADHEVTCGIATIMLVVGFAMVLGGGLVTVTRQEPKSELYALTSEVVNVDRKNDIVTCEDFNGYLCSLMAVKIGKRATFALW